MIAKSTAANILGYALLKGADFAELYFEDGRTTGISYNRAVQDITDNHIHGVGLYLIKGLNSVYVFDNDMSEGALRKLCDRGAALLMAKAAGAAAVPAFSETAVREPNPVKIRPCTVEHSKKIRLMEECDRAVRSMGPDVVSLSFGYNDSEKNVIIANSEGVWVEDSRTTVRFRATPTVADEHSSIGYFVEYTRPYGFEAFNDGAYVPFVQDAVKEMRTTLHAVEPPNGRYPVIIAAGNPSGTFFHECCGHQLETNDDPANKYDLLNNGIFYGKLGTKVASEKVTLVDDGTIECMYGSSKYDDEGMPRQKNVLIENGILKSYLVNRMGSLKLGVPRNASGRRQNYTEAPAARMSNTYLAPGTDCLEEMISSLPEGLYVTRMGGGHGGADFTIVSHTAYWIKNGAIDHQVKNAALMGRGDETMLKIDRVGGDMVWQKSGMFCGGASGLCNVTTSGPSLRISEMLIGGKGGK